MKHYATWHPLKPGADPIKNSSIDFDSTLEYWPIREAKIGHVTGLIGKFQQRVKFNAGILFIGLDAGQFQRISNQLLLANVELVAAHSSKPSRSWTLHRPTPTFSELRRLRRCRRERRFDSEWRLQRRRRNGTSGVGPTPMPTTKSTPPTCGRWERRRRCWRHASASPGALKLSFASEVEPKN